MRKEKYKIIGSFSIIILFAGLLLLVTASDDAEAVKTKPDFEIVSGTLSFQKVGSQTQCTVDVKNTGVAKVSGTVYIKFYLFNYLTQKVGMKGYATETCTFQNSWANGATRTVTYNFNSILYYCLGCDVNPQNDAGYPACTEETHDSKNTGTYNTVVHSAYMQPIDYNIAMLNMENIDDVEFFTLFEVSPSSARDKYEISVTDTQPIVSYEECDYINVRVEAIDPNDAPPMTVTFISEDISGDNWQTNLLTIEN